MKVLKIAVVVFWLAMVGLLFYFEVAPGIFGYKQLSYLDLIPKDLMLEDNWLGVYFQGVKIGYMHTYLSVSQEKQLSQFSLKNNTFLELPILGRTEEVHLKAEALIDSGYKLKDFSLDLSSPHYSTKIKGQLNRQGTLTLAITSGGKQRELQFNLPREAVLYSPLVPLPAGKLTLGKKFSAEVFDPLSLEVEKVLIEPLGTERLTMLDREFTAIKLKIVYKGIESLAWITKEGQLLKEQTPMGWLIVQEKPEEVLDFIKQRPQIMVDLIASTSLPSNIEIPQAQEISFLKVNLKGYVLDVEYLKDRRQSISDLGKNEIILSITALGPPDEPAFLPITENAVLPFLKPSIFIQADDEEIVKTAQQIVGEEKQSWKAAVLLNQWVYQHVRKVPTVSIPSSIEVLHQMQGDCNEHAFLYTALARSLGIPTKIAYGLLYQQGAFFYHAWPQVFVGKWVDIDPTLGQDIASATHIKLLEGEVKSQLDLVRILGKLDIEIKEFR